MWLISFSLHFAVTRQFHAAQRPKFLGRSCRRHHCLKPDGFRFGLHGQGSGEGLPEVLWRKKGRTLQQDIALQQGLPFREFIPAGQDEGAGIPGHGSIVTFVRPDSGSGSTPVMKSNLDPGSRSGWRDQAGVRVKSRLVVFSL